MSAVKDRLVSLPHWAIGLTAIVAVLVTTVVVFGGFYKAPFEPGTRTVIADFDRVTQLRGGDQVRLEGEIKGEVAKIEPAPDGNAARVTMEVEEDAGPIYADASARVRFKTLLGASLYVELDRGTEAAGTLESEMIDRERTDVQVEIEDVTGIFRDQAVSGFKTLPKELAAALENERALPRLFEIGNEVAPEATVAINALRGQQPDEDLRMLVKATADTVEALDSDGEDVRALVSGAASTLSVASSRGAEIRQAIDQGPAVTRHLTGTLARLDGTLDVTRGLVARLQPPAPDVAPTLRGLRPNLVRTNRLLSDARPLLKILRPTAGSLAAAGRSGTPFIEGLLPTLRRTDETILPYLGREDPETGKSTTVMIGGNITHFAAIAAQQDTNGHFIRFPASVGASSAYIPCTSTFIDPSVADPLVCDSLNQAIDEYMNYTAPTQQLQSGEEGP